MPATKRKDAARPSVAPPSARAGASSAALDPIITMNSAGVIQSASASVEQVFGWTPDELFGRNFDVLIPRARRPTLGRYLDRYRGSDRSVSPRRTGRFEAVRKDGGVFLIELSVSRADLPTHSVPFFVGIVRDVSGQAGGAEESLDRSRLQSLVTEQTRALASANLRLAIADRLASLGTLASGLRHDMNSVLLPVRMRLNALEASGISPGARAHVGAIRGSVQYLQQLCDGLHYLSEDPADEREQETTDLGQWWAQAGGLLCRAVPKHVGLRASVPPGLPVVAIASHELTQAVLNLIVNAGESIPARRNGLGRVRFAARVMPDGRVRLSVSDNGRGMTPKVLARAFDLFFTTKTRRSGTGLGLPLVSKMAAKAGGKVEVRSLAGKGTTVVLWLPAVSPGAAEGARDKRTFTVSIRDSRGGALVSQFLVAAGLTGLAPGGGDPRTSDIWVTEPTPAALLRAGRWAKRRPKRGLVLFGAPTRQSRGAWKVLGAGIIEDVDDFVAIREAVARATRRTGPVRRATA